MKKKITKTEFIKKAKENALKSGYIANLLDSDVCKCDCDYADCEGWSIATPPSQYLSPNIIISNIKSEKKENK